MRSMAVTWLRAVDAEMMCFRVGLFSQLNYHLDDLKKSVLFQADLSIMIHHKQYKAFVHPPMFV